MCAMRFDGIIFLSVIGTVAASVNDEIGSSTLAIIMLDYEVVGPGQS